jgi:hypothetical protein
LAYIDQKLEEYNQALASADGDQKQEIEANINKHRTQQNRYKRLEKELKQTGEKQAPNRL